LARTMRLLAGCPLELVNSRRRSARVSSTSDDRFGESVGFGVVSIRRSTSSRRASSSSLASLDMAKPSPEHDKEPTARQLASSHRVLKEAAAELVHAWAELESALAFLFAVMLAKPETGRACLEVFFAPSNMETRIKMVDTALVCLLRESRWKTLILPEWITIQNSLNRSKSMRNEVVHGMRATVSSSELPTQPRIIPSRFNTARMFDRKSGTPVTGPGANEIRNSIAAVYNNIDGIRILALAWRYVETDDEKPLRETLVPLTDRRLKEAPPQAAQKPPKQKRQRRS